MSDIVPRNKNEIDTVKVLEKTIDSIIEGFTGIVASKKKDLMVSVGHILQRMRSVTFLQALHDEWSGYRKKGKIKDDYIGTEQHQVCLQELLDYLDKEPPEEIKFSFLKKVFLAAATEANSNRNDVLPQQYLRVCRKLNSGEILVLQTVHQGGTSNFDQVKKLSGLGHSELVADFINSLKEKQLLSGGSNIALSGLGKAICNYIQTYDEK